MSKAKPRYSAKRFQETQPPEWEALLSDVTVPPHYLEQPINPAQCAYLKSDYDMNDFFNLPVSQFSACDYQEKIQQLRTLADKKLKGLTRKVILLLLSTDFTETKLAQLLAVDQSQVSRHIQTGIKQLKPYITSKQTGQFPTPKNSRPPVRVAIFPLDSDEEKQAFQDFLNQETVIHLSYRGESIFREAMVVYITGKGKKTLPKAS